MSDPAKAPCPQQAVAKLQSAKRSLAISQRAVSAALEAAKRKRKPASSAGKVSKRRKGGKSKKAKK